MKMNYQKGVELALANGYEGVDDANAYNGIYYIRDGLIWIHNIEALKSHLGVESTDELRALSYDVDAYEEYQNHTNEMVDDELKGLYNDLSHGDGQPVYLMDGVYLFADGSTREL
jgi:hypothetical protein